MRVPEGLSARPLRMEDAGAVYELMAADQLDQIGMVEIEEADIVGDWGRPSYDVGDSAIGIFDGDQLVGYGDVFGPDRGDAAVHPDHRGRGIGTAVAEFMQEKVRSRGGSVIGMPVPQGSHGDRLLEALGYHVRWTSWVLKLPAGASIVERPLPEGYVVRAADPAEYRDLHRVIDAAFLEWSVRDPEPFEDFEASVMGRPGFEPWNLRVVIDPDGRVVGGAQVLLSDTGDGRDPEAYINKLAVAKEHRNRGLAQALMVDAFTVAREHGALVSGLSTDSRTGALTLYEKVGMEVTSAWVNRAIAV